MKKKQLLAAILGLCFLSSLSSCYVEVREGHRYYHNRHVWYHDHPRGGPAIIVRP